MSEGEADYRSEDAHAAQCPHDEVYVVRMCAQCGKILGFVSPQELSVADNLNWCALPQGSPGMGLYVTDAGANWRTGDERSA